MTRRALPLLALCILVGCAAGAARPAPRPAGATVWLCRPGAVPDPCSGDLATTVIRADGTTTVEHPRPAARPPIDCFYVYPTVSPEPTGNSDLTIGLAETVVAQIQASRFSQVCRVYRADVPADHLGRARHAVPAREPARGLPGRARRLARLPRPRQPRPRRRADRPLAGRLHPQAPRLDGRRPLTRCSGGGSSRRSCSAGRCWRGTRPRRPATSPTCRPCTSASQTGCVVAYSSFASVPPPDARFGRVKRSSVHVLCVNPGRPGAPAGATAPITPLFPTAVTELMGGPLAAAPATPWVAFPGLYRASCRRTGTASWLQIDHRPRAATAAPSWATSSAPRGACTPSTSTSRSSSSSRSSAPRRTPTRPDADGGRGARTLLRSRRERRLATADRARRGGGPRPARSPGRREQRRGRAREGARARAAGRHARRGHGLRLRGLAEQLDRAAPLIDARARVARAHRGGDRPGALARRRGPLGRRAGRGHGRGADGRRGLRAVGGAHSRASRIARHARSPTSSRRRATASCGAGRT